MKKFDALLTAALFTLILLAGTVSVASAFGNPFYNKNDQKLFETKLPDRAQNGIDPKGDWRPAKIGSPDIYFRDAVVDSSHTEIRYYAGCVRVDIISDKETGTHEFVYCFNLIVVQRALWSAEKDTWLKSEPEMQFYHAGSINPKKKGFKEKMDKGKAFNENLLKEMAKNKSYDY